MKPHLRGIWNYIAEQMNNWGGTLKRVIISLVILVFL
jgi:hypothetical protein